MEEWNLILDSISNSEAMKSWSIKEEMALKVGVSRYGVGNWKSIQEDPELIKYLDSRYEEELQEKWQNMNVEASIPQPAIQDQLNVESNQIAESKRKMSEVDAEAELKAEDKIEAEADAEAESEAEAEAKTEAEVSEDP